jgi:hypothetical protein
MLVALAALLACPHRLVHERAHFAPVDAQLKLRHATLAELRAC